ncbi:hypothetical protein GOP47_0020998 [Adiantum capillus-veneris]|uniref:Uncharacterized protein n=1 Tax=Adiantum capillus-veneris TaxID=13818 RepID=A0A9D4Z6M8_ADICA|nr:hypothetical protein GOP47_0020998 [Adiantum capillus-veneris]
MELASPPLRRSLLCSGWYDCYTSALLRFCLGHDIVYGRDNFMVATLGTFSKVDVFFWYAMF